ncbi:metallophosphoesterase [Tropicimonas sp. TH_r6]|uniref:metallophosphoesterase n=1 Tax=Tropicimonas sp. TH_r6 TaxID=3082085 RepID=UPI002954F8EC|nr:metallophosphoesterase [Tropicimonas sp. TH_r6]MDV7141371.1 metallophosphoesterase [Tropicimonas sp. TH_r6]
MLSKLFRKRPPQVSFQPPAPEGVVEIVGDLHGRADLLQQLPPVEEGATRILVGDYVDRGPDSRSVLEIAHARSVEEGWICLFGNHEEMMLSFLKDPGPSRRWLRHGGLQTLESFGVGGVTESSEEERLRDAAAAVTEALTADLREWIEDLPTAWTSGTLCVVHAGLDPMLPVSMQPRSVKTWGHPDFGRVPRSDGIWVAHGHTIVDAPMAENGTISTDSGAYATGRLTMARVAPDGTTRFEEVSPKRR